MSQIKKEAAELTGWSLENETLVREFTFNDFLKGIDFVQNVSAYAEGAQHHPYVVIDHTTITIKWTTVDEGKLTRKDIEAAQACNNFYN